ncbi:hypothetical protein U0C82_03360 [Fulvimarina sp. 2208YS6-2-32]|uniref:DUF937 domain-containing protein n=1 Tax=Fulvimarina uroteuthidis TaxID=3098149 RepID=A0ABU5HYN8_9HYPH|nr:hypothetical protein [Fulvimarina sp. 2208YS6-2-32]MDY8108187.1 hypothetical protein [Fulvimarina sp. 2208YS6-2-32]
MTDFFDWLTTSDSGLAADRLANAYNLSPSELRDTTQALAPAFSLALMRAMSNPMTASNLSQQFAPFFGSSEATSRKAAEKEQVRAMTESLFGSKALVDAISRQVSSVTGTAPDTVEPLMRNLTLMAMQTMMQMVGASFARSMRDGDFTQQDVPANVADLMRRSANALEAFSRSPDEGRARNTDLFGMNNIFSDAFRGPLPWLPPMPVMSPKNAIKPKDEERSKAPSSTTGSDLPPTPFFAIFEGFSRGLQKAAESGGEQGASEGATTAATDGKPAPIKADAPPLSPDPSSFGRLMEASADMQADYLKRITALFDANPRKDEENGKS